MLNSCSACGRPMEAWIHCDNWHCKELIRSSKSYRDQVLFGEIPAVDSNGNPETEEQHQERVKRDQPGIVPVRPHDQYEAIRARLIKLRVQELAGKLQEGDSLPDEAFLASGMTEEELKEMYDYANTMLAGEEWTSTLSIVVDTIMTL